MRPHAILLKSCVCLCVSSPSERTKVTVIQGDITDYSSVLEASRGVDVVIHTASLVDVWYKVPETLIYAVNVAGGHIKEVVMWEKREKGMERKHEWVFFSKAEEIHACFCCKSKGTVSHKLKIW